MTYFIYGMIIISFMDTFSQLPIISPYAKQLGASSLMIGFVIGMYSFSNMFSNVLVGPFIDRIGRKKVIILGMLLTGTSLVFYPVVQTAEQLLFVRFIHGLGGGILIPAAFAFLGDLTTDQNRGKTMAKSGAAIGIAAILGPAFGGIVSARYGIQWVFYTVALLLIVGALCALFYLPDQYKRQEKQKIQLRDVLYLLNQPGLVNAYLSAFSLMFTLGIVTYMLPLKVSELGYTSQITGLLLSSYGMIAILFFILPTNRLTDRIGRTKPILFGFLMISLAMFVLGAFHALPYLLASMLLFGTGFALLFPAMTALVIDHSRPEERGRAFGWFYAFYSLGVVVGPIVVGSLHFSPNQGIWFGSAFMFVMANVLLYRTKAKQKISPKV